MKRRVGIYARVSTANGQSPESQLRDLRELAGRRNFRVVKEYIDQGVSGATHSRPALDELVADARRGRFDAVLIWKLDSLGRSLIHLARQLEEWQGVGIELISCSEGLDFTTPTGKLLFQVVSAFAEFERDCIRERVCAGMRNTRAHGKRIGRPPVVVDATEVARLRAQDTSWRKIAAKLDVGATTARRVLSRLAKTPAKSSVPSGSVMASQRVAPLS
jgi:DNA invertase Pin-like site-specific DNA recombinase